jgi:hypothetical protein
MGVRHVKIRRHSKVDALSIELQAEINNLLIDDKTYEEISEYLKSKGIDISRSALGRYGKDFLNRVRELRIIQDQAKTLVDDAGGDGLVLEEAGSKLIAQKIIQLLLKGGADAARLPFLVSDFAKLQTSSVQRERLKAEFKKKAANTIKKIEKDSENLSKEEMLKMIREEVYGLGN